MCRSEKEPSEQLAFGKNRDFQVFQNMCFAPTANSVLPVTALYFRRHKDL